jgi:hypothetical protein
VKRTIATTSLPDYSVYTFTENGLDYDVRCADWRHNDHEEVCIRGREVEIEQPVRNRRALGREHQLIGLIVLPRT